jgi:hypothetical protein
MEKETILFSLTGFDAQSFHIAARSHSSSNTQTMTLFAEFQTSAAA